MRTFSSWRRGAEVLAFAVIVLCAPGARGAEENTMPTERSVGPERRELPAPRYQPPTKPVGVPEGRTSGAARGPKYVPPREEVPGGRTKGAVRDVLQPCGDPGVDLLAPYDHVGYTTSPAPDLFWSVKELPDQACAQGGWRFTLIDPRPQAIDPIVEVTLPNPTQPGVQRVHLGEYHPELHEGTRYEWSITLLQTGSDQRATDPFARAPLLRVPAPADLPPALPNMRPDERAAEFATRGLWYDMLDQLDRALRSRPNDASLRAWRQELVREQQSPQIGGNKSP